jgi:predicted lipid-binding transport protein (Tim44 family)
VVFPVQFLPIIIFAILAAVVLYQLYAVLGRRVGRQPEDLVQAIEPAHRDGDVKTLTREAAEAGALTGLAALKARDASFDVNHFLSGARRAYEMIVRSFASGDRDDLRPLVSKEVFKHFDEAITAREGRGDTETVEFLHAPRADIEEVSVTGDKARIKVRFLAEHRSRTHSAEGEAVDDRRTAELWTFERDVTSRDPNWVLVDVDAAEA